MRHFAVIGRSAVFLEAYSEACADQSTEVVPKIGLRGKNISLFAV